MVSVLKSDMLPVYFAPPILTCEAPLAALSSADLRKFTKRKNIRVKLRTLTL